VNPAGQHRLIANEDCRKRFELEARASAALEHANIVRVYGTLNESVPAIVYEYCDGGTVESLVKERDCPLPTAEILEIAIGVAESVNKISLVDTDSIVEVGEWVHVAAVYDTYGVTIYVNGTPVEYDVSLYTSAHANDSGSVADNQVLPSPLIITEVWPGAELHFGSLGGVNFPFAGRVGEVRLSRSAHYLGPFTPTEELARTRSVCFAWMTGNNNSKTRPVNIQDT